MLQITIPSSPETEYYDERTNTFFTVPGQKGQTITLEHSLVSISKWESKWHKPFLSDTQKTRQEQIDYIKCMTLTQNVDPKVYNNLSKQNMEDIAAYLENPMTATTFNHKQQPKGRKEIVTAEIIYYWMIACDIPFECQKWHLNKLLALIEVCNTKNTPAKKMGKKEMMAQNKALNDARRKKYNSKG